METPTKTEKIYIAISILIGVIITALCAVQIIIHY